MMPFINTVYSRILLHILIPFSLSVAAATFICSTSKPLTSKSTPRTSQIPHVGSSRLENEPSSVPASINNMPGPTYTQHAFSLQSYPRGSYLITSDIISQLSDPLKGVKAGLLHLFLQHTSCGLSLNENYDSDVRKDMSDSLDRIVVEDKGALGGGCFHWYKRLQDAG